MRNRQRRLNLGINIDMIMKLECLDAVVLEQLAVVMMKGLDVVSVSYSYVIIALYVIVASCVWTVLFG